MASELRVTTIANNAGSESVDTTYVVNGSAKAIFYFDGSTPALLKTFNISSLTDNGTGQHDGNFTSSMDSINFSAPASSRTGGGAGDKHYTCLLYTSDAADE